jgi:mannose-6-phosphate isomerase-like protein (cupin superfamily)
MQIRTRLLSSLLACASSLIMAGAQSEPAPSPEVKKLEVIVGKFTIEDELKAGFMGPDSPAMKFSGTDDCRWTANGFAVICESALYRPGRKKYSETSFYYYDPTAKTYRYHAVDSSGGVEDKTGTVSGDVWTWLGDSVFGGKVYHTRYTMKVVSEGFEYTDESGESENSMKVFVSGKETRVAATEPEKSQPVHAGATPLLLEKDEGEARLWRPEPGEVDIRGFILKVTPKSNGSEHLVLGTEDMPPGAAIPTHKHLGQDEIVLIEKGTIHAHVGDQERDLHAGGMVFIPQRTWVNLKNTGTEPASITFLFSAPGFEDHLRCESVPASEKPTTISIAEENECDRLGHVVYRDRGEKDPDK